MVRYPLVDLATYESPVLMSVPSTSTNEIVSSKQYFVNRVSGNNDIDTSTYLSLLPQSMTLLLEKKSESSVKMEHCLTD